MKSKPRLGFLGVGWIGRHRMSVLNESKIADVVAIADPDPAALEEARAIVPKALALRSYEELLEQKIDGVVIATPSALHARQAISALERGLAVFCQKPLGRNAEEVSAVVATARRADRLLDVDLSYRFTEGFEHIRRLVQSGELGHVFSAEMVFHNAYGPDKSWFYRRDLAGGGCLLDLGIHLVDGALWCMDFPSVVGVSGRLFSGGRRLPPRADEVEDYALAELDLEDGGVIHIGCSWNLPAGQDAAIAATFYGTGGGVSLTNVNGSFYDFRVDLFRGTARHNLTLPPDAWGGRALVAWAERLGKDGHYDARAERSVQVAELIDAIYGGGFGS